MNIQLEWTKQNPNFNTITDDIFPNTIPSPNGIYCLYQTNGNAKGSRLKGGYDIVLFEMNSSGTVEFIYQKPEWNTEGYSRLSYQALAQYQDFLYFTYWTNQPIDGNEQTGKFDIVVCKTDRQGTIHWIKQQSLPNASGWNTWSAITTDTQGNVIVAFTTTGTITQDTNAQRVGRDVDSNLVVFKLDSNGELVWARQRAELNTTFGSSSRPSVVCDVDNNIYVGYACSGAVQNRFKTSVTATDVVIAKLSHFDGVEIWVKQDDDLNTVLTNTAPILAINKQNDLYVVYSSSTRVKEKNINYYTARKGNTDLVISQLSSNTGEVVWLRQRQEFNTIGNDTPYGVFCDDDNNIYVSFNITIMNIYHNKILREDCAVVRLSTYGDMEILKYDEELNYQESTYRHLCPKVLLSNNEVYVVYSFTNFLQTSIYNQEFNEIFIETNSDIVVKKLRLTQKVDDFLIWTKQDTAMNTTKRDISPHVAVDASNHCVVVYMTNGAVQGYSNSGFYDIVVFKTDASGQVLWAKQSPAWNTAGMSSLSKQSLVVDADRNIIFAYTTTLFAVDGQSMTGKQDIVLVKLNPQGELIWVQQQALPNTVGRNTQPTLTLDRDGNLVMTLLTNNVIPLSKVGSREGHVPIKVGGLYHLNMVVCKVDATTGYVLWAIQDPLLNSAYGSVGQVDVAISSNNEIVIAYVASGAIPDFSLITHTSTDVVVAKLSTEGMIIWRKQDTELNTILTNTAPYVSMSEDNHIIVVYSSSGSLNGEGNGIRGDTDVVVAKLDTSNGSKIWLHQQVNWNTKRQDTPYSMLVDVSGNIYVAYTTYQATINNEPSQREDVALLKLDASGSFLYAQQDKSLNHRLGDYRHTAPKIALDVCGNILMSYGFTRFKLDDHNNQQLDRKFRVRKMMVRAIEYNREQNSEESDLGDSDIVLLKINGENGGIDEDNTDSNNDGTEVEDDQEIGKPEVDPDYSPPPPISTGAVIRIPIVLDASANPIIYGENEPDYDYSYNVFITTDEFNSILFGSFLQYVEVEASDIEPEGTFHFTYNSFFTEDICGALHNDIGWVEGRVQNKESGLQEFESGHVVQNGTLGVLFLRYFADILFNHPEAQAPIRNDNEIIEQVNERSKLNEQFIAKVTENLMDRVSYMSATPEQKSRSKNIHLRSMLEQMFVQVPQRFTRSEDGVPISIPFQTGDEISFLIRMNGRIALDSLQTYNTIGDGKFSAPITNFFLENTIKNWKLDPSNIRKDDPALLVTKMWKMTMTLS